MRRNSVGIVILIVGMGSAASNPTRNTPQAPVTAPDNEGRSYALKLGSLFIPPSSVTGLFVRARIDGGPALRLLLDSGAQSIVLDKRAAAKSGYSGGSELDLVGVGTSPKVARMAKARTVEVGDLELHDCGLIIVDGKLLDGIDGVIPLSLFSGFLVRLDIPGKTLDLGPYPTDGPPGGLDFSHARASNNLLFIRGFVNDSTEGYFLLDTGAFYNAISERTARALRLPRMFASSVPLQGGAGAVDGKMYSSEVRFRFGSRVLLTTQVVVVPLDQLERYHRMEVEGVLGFPALSESVLSIDYRNGLVRIAEK
jgi:predicted aspartyl protease